MSDTPQGAGWWRASDGKWYSPERHPEYTPSAGAAAVADGPPQPGWWKASDGEWYPPEQLPPGYQQALAVKPEEGTDGGLRGCIGYALLGVVALICFGMLFYSASTYDEADEPDQPDESDQPVQVPDTTFSATVSSIVAYNPATVVATVMVTNTGAFAGTPYCDVRVEDPSGTYKGWELFEFEELEPGESRQFNAQLTVTNEGAVFATNGSADC